MEETEIRAALEPLLPEGVYLKVYPRPGDNAVVNIDRRKGDLTLGDVTAARNAFAKLGWTETDAWLPRQGMSWLSDGVSAGVSFRLVTA